MADPSSREGVIKFKLDFRSGPAPALQDLVELNAWRQIFYRLGLLGQDPTRYQGLGFGNLSKRLPQTGESAFLVSGTQTGSLAVLSPADYTTVLECNPGANWVVAAGPVKPSSEALSHGAVYLANPSAKWVMHLHSPDVFSRGKQLGLPSTDPAAEYGTPAMAQTLLQLVQRLNPEQPHVIMMSGHEDGILAFGEKPNAVGALVVETLAMAMGLAQADRIDRCP